MELKMNRTEAHTHNLDRFRWLAMFLSGWLLAGSAWAAETFVLDAAGRLTRADYGAAGVITYAYDSLGHLTNLVVQGSAKEVDSDNDKLPDAWEWVYFNGLSQKPGDDPNRNGRTNLQDYQQGTDPATDDNDGDGSSNAAEIAAGTDPFDANSSWKIQVVSTEPLTLSWAGAPGRSYRVQRAASPVGVFEDLTGFLPNQTPINTWTDPASPPGGAFYRVELKPD